MVANLLLEVMLFPAARVPECGVKEPPSLKTEPARLPGPAQGQGSPRMLRIFDEPDRPGAGVVIYRAAKYCLSVLGITSLFFGDVLDNGRL